MNNQIKCPNCKTFFEPTDAYKHELEEKLLRESNSKHEVEIKAFLDKQAQLELQKQEEIEQVKRETFVIARKEAVEKVRKEYDVKITSTKEEAQEKEKQNQELQKQTIELMKQLRESRDAESRLKIHYEKTLLEEQDKIKQDAKKEAEDALSLKMAEKDKQLDDARKVNGELQRKLEQKSQQLQGEVQELKLEELLKSEFPFDEISEVPKGKGGADTIQVVRTQTGVLCGTIVWESKRAQRWDQKWIQKLIEDQRAVKADLAVLVSTAFPESIANFGMVESIFVTDLKSATSVAYLLRQQLMRVHSVSVANSDKATKAEVVYNYLISNEFKQRIEVWVEYFRERQDKINKERVYFNKKWQEEEKSIHKVIANTSGIYGDLQGLIGNALPKVDYLELPDQEEAQPLKLL